jgi:hypothetical protein
VTDVKLGKISDYLWMGRFFSFRWKRLHKVFRTAIADGAKMA